MSRRKSKNTLRKKNKGKKYQRRSRRATRKGRGYQNECLFPTPETRGNNKNDSCSLIDLNDTYGLTEMEDLGVEGNKQCNMFYYLDNGNFYRCRNRNKSGTKCNKRGAYSSGKIKCGPAAVQRIKAEEPPLLAELEELMRQSSNTNPVVSPSMSTSQVRASSPVTASVPTSTSMPSSSLSIPSSSMDFLREQPTMPRTSGTSSSKARASNATRRRINPQIMQPFIDKLNASIARLETSNQKLLSEKNKHLADAKKPGITLAMKRHLVRRIRITDAHIKTNDRLKDDAARKIQQIQRLIR